MGDKLRIYDQYGVLQEFDPIDAAGTIDFTANQSMGSNKLTSVGAPSSDGDALSKGDAVLVGTEVAVAADDNVIGGIQVVHRILLASGANADHNVTLTHKTRILEAWVVMKGDGTTGSTVIFKSTGNAITDTLDCFNTDAVNDRDIVRASEIDDGTHEIAAGGVLRVTTASGSSNFPGAEAYVLGIRVA